MYWPAYQSERNYICRVDEWLDASGLVCIQPMDSSIGMVNVYL